MLLKREDMQPVFSFKLRGAYNKMAHLPAARAQARRDLRLGRQSRAGRGLAAQQLGCRATIVMPATTPRIKVAAVAARGARVVLHGDSYDDAYAHALTLAQREQAHLRPPLRRPGRDRRPGHHRHGDPAQHSGPIDAIFVAVGGGGLISGIAAYVKRLRPEIKIIGVEPIDADAMTRSLEAGHRVRLAQVGLFADGVAVKQVGEETFRLCRELVDEMVLVDNDDICAAIKDVFEDTRSILEPAGALAVAGAKAWVERRRTARDARWWPSPAAPT